ncbi:MAG: hypothetical protein NZM25_01000 [Leptospiraceae bacterium]|nr:hypothetical protein [Leptospiraceae bacterium]MDW8306301.1 hypothetical protein [Leptospiraceae bacterium]
MHRLFFHIALWLVFKTFLLAYVPDRAGIERKLKENRYFLEFINAGISNFGDEKSRQLLQKAATEHYRAYRAYLQGHYDISHDYIRQSQLILRDLYVYMYDNIYRRDALYLLKSNSVVVVSSRDERAIKLLNLGYRDVKHADIYRKKGYHYPEHLYSIKIYSYIDGIKYLRQAKRYAFLAIIETHTPLPDKADFKKQTPDDYFNREKAEFLEDYLRVKNILTNMIDRKYIINDYDYFSHHDDNYGYISYEKPNLLEKYLNEAEAYLAKQK